MIANTLLPKPLLLACVAMASLVSAFSTALSQPLPGAITWEYAATVKPVSLTYIEKLRDTSKPLPPVPRTSGLNGALMGVVYDLAGYEKVSTYKVKVGDVEINESSWAPKSAKNNSPESEFNGEGKASLTMSGVGEYMDGDVGFTPDGSKLTYEFTGLARNLPDFQREFRQRVEAEIGRATAALKGTVPLEKVEKDKLKTPPGPAQQLREFKFFDQKQPLPINITSKRTIVVGALGEAP